MTYKDLLRTHGSIRKAAAAGAITAANGMEPSKIIQIKAKAMTFLKEVELASDTKVFDSSRADQIRSELADLHVLLNKLKVELRAEQLHLRIL